jgi:hypothetical protein
MLHALCPMQEKEKLCLKITLKSLCEISDDTKPIL